MSLLSFLVGDTADATDVVITGPAGGGKTTVLFQFGMRVASLDPSFTVLLICRRDRMYRHPPLCVVRDGEEDTHYWEEDALDRVLLKYVDSPVEVRQLLACLHLMPEDSLPDAVLLDDLEEFSRTPIEALKLHGLLHSAVSFLSERKGRMCPFACTLSHNTLHPLLDLLNDLEVLSLEWSSVGPGPQKECVLVRSYRRLCARPVPLVLPNSVVVSLTLSKLADRPHQDTHHAGASGSTLKLPTRSSVLVAKIHLEGVTEGQEEEEERAPS